MPEQTHASALVRMHATRHGLDEDTRRSIVIMLNQRLSDAADLYSQTKHAHWNVKGMDFYQLHLLFDELAESVEKHIDLLAERITALGGTALGTIRMASQNSNLPEMPTDIESGRDYLEALVERYAKHGRGIGEGIDRAEDAGDRVTEDLLTQIAQDVDKGLYFLESHLQGKSPR